MNPPTTAPNDESPAWLDLFLARLRFAFKSQRLPIILTAVFMLWIITDGLTGWKIGDGIKTLWNNELDQVTSLATLMVALFVWYGEIATDYKNNLPKRLTVQFETVADNGRTTLVMRCDKAHLSDVADIRALGQQIAMQMCGGKPIHFRAPYVKQNIGVISLDANNKHFLHYTVTFTLTKTPDDIPDGKFKLWDAPFGTENLRLEELVPWT